MNNHPCPPWCEEAAHEWSPAGACEAARPHTACAFTLRPASVGGESGVVRVEVCAYEEIEALTAVRPDGLDVDVVLMPGAVPTLGAPLVTLGDAWMTAVESRKVAAALLNAADRLDDITTDRRAGGE